MSETREQQALDLWGEPLPDPLPQTALLGPHHLDIPESWPAWLRESLLRREPSERDAAIQQILDREAARERRRRRDKERTRAGNPCISLYGAGPEGTTCASCVHLFVRQYAGTYYKCELRRDSKAPTTDHRKRWPACARYVERSDERPKEAQS